MSPDLAVDVSKIIHADPEKMVSKLFRARELNPNAATSAKRKKKARATKKRLAKR